MFRRTARSAATRRRLAVGLAGALLLSCGPERPGDVVLITVDTLRPDHMSLYGYPRRTTPHLTDWFGKGRIFERSYSTEANTSPSVMSLLTGRLPQRHRVRLLYQRAPRSDRLLPELLPESYQTVAFVSNVVLTDEALGIAGRFDHYDDFVDEPVGGDKTVVYERDARRTTDAVLRWLRERADPDRPLLLWVHYIDPHGPYDPPEGADRHFETELSDSRKARIRAALETRRENESGDSRLQVTTREMIEKIDLYDAEIRFLDTEIGRLLQGYAELRDADRALMVFTADHGESMTEHEHWFTHGYQVYDEIIRVPLALRGPGVEPGRPTGLASGIDIVPTIMSFVSGTAPEGLPGIDLRHGSVPSDRVVFSEATQFGHWRAAVQGSSKWVVGTKQGSRKIVDERFYDLAADPHELAPRSKPTKRPPLIRLLKLIRKDPDPGGYPRGMKRGMMLHAPKVDPRVNAEQLEKLRALGYVQDESVPAPPEPPHDEPD